MIFWRSMSGGITGTWSEPFADASQIPTYIVSALARQDVTVVLSGDGGDETFAGYNTYASSLREWRKMQKKKASLPRRRVEAFVKGHTGDLLWTVSGGRRFPFDPKSGRATGARIRDEAITLPAADAPDFFGRRQRLRLRNVAQMVNGARPLPTILNEPSAFPRLPDPLRALTAYDYVTYMVDDVLVKVDRASMGASLEVRCPLLDYRAAEFSWRLPAEMLNGTEPNSAKIILKEVLWRYVLNDPLAPGIDTLHRDEHQGFPRKWNIANQAEVKTEFRFGCGRELLLIEVWIRD